MYPKTFVVDTSRGFEFLKILTIRKEVNGYRNYCTDHRKMWLPCGLEHAHWTVACMYSTAMFHAGFSDVHAVDEVRLDRLLRDSGKLIIAILPEGVG